MCVSRFPIDASVTVCVFRVNGRHTGPVRDADDHSADGNRLLERRLNQTDTRLCQNRRQDRRFRLHHSLRPHSTRFLPLHQ